MVQLDWRGFIEILRLVEYVVKILIFPLECRKGPNPVCRCPRDVSEGHFRLSCHRGELGNLVFMMVRQRRFSGKVNNLTQSMVTARGPPTMRTFAANPQRHASLSRSRSQQGQVVLICSIGIKRFLHGSLARVLPACTGFSSKDAPQARTVLALKRVWHQNRPVPSRPEHELEEPDLKLRYFLETA